MVSKILDGKALAKLAEEDIRTNVSKLKEKGITPTLATILVGLDPASATYVKMKQNACARLGMDSIAVELSKDTTTDELLDSINKLNNDENVHVSGHPSRDELIDMYSFVKPKISIPVHGTREHIDAHAKLANECQVPIVLKPTSRPTRICDV